MIEPTGHATVPPMVGADLLTPSPDGPIAAAAWWVEGALLGSVATAVAVIAVAAVGLLMLTGRVDIRRGATVVIGCFIVFGASTIVAGLQSAVQGVGQPIDPAPVIVAPPVVAPASPPKVPAASDPYAGASVPKNR